MDLTNQLPPGLGMQQLSDHRLPQSTVLHGIIADAKQRNRSPTTTGLNNVLLNHQTHFSDSNFLDLHSNTNHLWPSTSVAYRSSREGVRVSDGSMVPGAVSRESADLNNNNDACGNDNGELMDCGGAGGISGGERAVKWQNMRCKADILSHALYDQLLSTHVACLRIATPVDQLPRIDAQLSQSDQVIAKYSAYGHGNFGDDSKELDQFMMHYVLLLCSFKEQLQQHVRVHAMEAVMACWEIEQSLQSLTGVSPGEGTGATMSDDDDDQLDSDTNLFDGSLDGPDGLGFGPLILTESEKSLMERVRHELKHELKNGYQEKIAEIREEILRKRRAGKLPGDTTSVLKAWWQSHSKWPYPSEEDKARLVEETGLELKQINNWFINQRKRNWHSNASSSTASKNKRKR